MLLGFISLTLLVVENDLAKICLNNDPFWDSWGGVRCSEHSTPATDSTDNCPDGQRAFLDIRAMHQVHVLIFVVAIIHVTCVPSPFSYSFFVGMAYPSSPLHGPVR